MTTALIGRRRLAPSLLVALGLWSAALAVIAAAPSTAVAFMLVPWRGSRVRSSTSPAARCCSDGEAGSARPRLRAARGHHDGRLRGRLDHRLGVRRSPEPRCVRMLRGAAAGLRRFRPSRPAQRRLALRCPSSSSRVSARCRSSLRSVQRRSRGLPAASTRSTSRQDRLSCGKASTAISSTSSPTESSTSRSAASTWPRSGEETASVRLRCCATFRARRP